MTENLKKIVVVVVKVWMRFPGESKMVNGVLNVKIVAFILLRKINLWV